MSPAYAPVFAALHAEAFPQEAWSEASFASLLAQPGVLGFLDERGGFLLLRIVLDEAEILTIGSVTRRQGIATALLREGLAQAAANGVKTIHLEVAADNLPARALYARLGFVLSGRRTAYYANGEDALTLSLVLI